jgi:antitoxin component YwqK of YwqJK toxin-antitoxin module
MKKIYLIISTITTLTVLTACNPSVNRRSPVIDQTYVHRYGIEVPPDQWTEGGRTGQVVSTLKTGVIVTNNYSDGILNGDTVYTFPHSDSIQKIETYENGQLVKEIHHSVTGTPMKETIHNMGNKKIITIWYDDGTPQAKEVYENNVLTQGEYYDNQHQLEARIENGQGNRINRDLYGILESNDTVVNGQMTLRTTYHPNGHPKEVTPYSYGSINGERRTFLPAGEPNTIEQWSMGVQQGNTVVYKNGEKYADITYSGGKKNGLERRYKNGDTVVEEITWVADQRQGPSYTYINDNTKTEWYHGGRIVTKGAFDMKANPPSSR